MLPLWYSTIYTHGLDPAVRFPRNRYELVRAGLEQAGAAGIKFEDPEPIADLTELREIHCERYVQRFLSQRLDEAERRRIGLQPWTHRIIDRTLRITNGTLAAMRHALSTGGVAGNLGGGTHHAYRDFGSGYCIFNDLALAARLAIRDHGIRRVLILDLDVHQGDGTASIFAGVEEVRTVSFHCEKNFPARKMRSDLDVSLSCDTGDEEYLELLDHCLEREPHWFEPDLLLYQAGVDGLASDRLGNLKLSRAGLRRRNERVFSFARQHSLPLVITMGGGYGEPIETSVAAHVEVFLQAAEMLT